MWTCPDCGRVFRNTRQWHSCQKENLEGHFRNRPPALRQLFDELNTFITELGPVEVSPVKTAILFRRGATFLAVNVKPDHLKLEFQLEHEAEDLVISRSVRVSGNRVFHEAVIDEGADIHERLKQWITEAYGLISGTNNQD